MYIEFISFISSTEFLLLLLCIEFISSIEFLLLLLCILNSFHSFSLAAADVLFVVFCVPFTAARYAMSTWPFGYAWCKIYQYIINVTAYASVYTLVLMSLDRYLAVVHPILSMPLRTEKNARRGVLVTWTVICLLNSYIPFEYGVEEYAFGNELRSDCINVRVFREFNAGNLSSAAHARLLQGTFFTFGYLVPLTVVCALYGLMLRRFLRDVPPGASQSVGRVRSRRRVTRMVVFVVLVFAVCWLPIHVVFMCLYFGNVERIRVVVTLQVN